MNHTLCCRRTGLMFVGVIVASAALIAEVPLPGTQPLEGGIEFAKVQQCIMCHSQTPNGAADPVFSWQGGMMAQAGRDPVFRAAMTVANQDIEGVGEYCLRCHAPRGWLEGRSTPTDGSALNREDMQGVSCDVCHRFVDPMSAEAKALVKQPPPGYGNAMMVVDPQNMVRGPYGDGRGAMPHRVAKSEFHAAGELCATCHNVSNPLHAEDATQQPPHAYGHIERTYSEWRLSDFADPDNGRTCQSCHYPTVEGGGQASRYTPIQRDHFVKHGPVGGSTWTKDAVAMLWKTRDVDPKALEVGKQRARALLKTAAELDLTFPASDRAVLRITNLTGHKLPTGYPEGRRMWVHARYLDADGKLLGEIGQFGMIEDSLAGEAVTVPTLIDPDRTTVYESLPGLSPEHAEQYGKEPGPSFHFVLNDVILKDNRIPPRGFSNERFTEHLCEPIGAEYADGQYWDDVSLALPPGTHTVDVRLMYQSVSWEYLKFLIEQNRTDDWGTRLHEAWLQLGQGQPEPIAELKASPAG